MTAPLWCICLFQVKPVPVPLDILPLATLRLSKPTFPLVIIYPNISTFPELKARVLELRIKHVPQGLIDNQLNQLSLGSFIKHLAFIDDSRTLTTKKHTLAK